MATKKTILRRILISLTFDHGSNRSFIRGIALYSRIHANWRITFVDSRELTGELIAKRLEEAGGKIDAIISKETAAPVIRGFFGDKMPPMAILGTPANGIFMPDTIYFTANGVATGRFAANYLLSLGNFASYGFFAADSVHNFIHTRCEGFISELAKYGKAASISLSHRDDNATRQWLLSLKRPAAIFCASDYYALRLLEICNEIGLDVPEQISVLGVDNDDTLGLFAQPPLSSIKLSHEEIGFAAAREIERRLKRGTAFSSRRNLHIMDKISVVERDSTSAPSPGTHLVNNAIDFITQNAGSKLSVEDVVEHLGISRQLLEKRFHEFGYKPVKQTIIDIRLKIVCKMLVSSDKPIRSIAESCGFKNEAWLKTLFRNKTGMTMNQYRKQHILSFD